MARATTKEELLQNATEEFAKMWQRIDSLTEKQRESDFHFSEEFLEKQKETHWRRDKNLRDVLIHLYEWHQLLLHWVHVNQSGVKTPFLPEPYNWKTYGAMNQEFWQKHQSTTYAQAKDMLLESHQQVLAMIQTFSSEELFTKAYFSWTGTTSLGSYCVSATSSHYDWAIKKIKQYIRNGK